MKRRTLLLKVPKEAVSSKKRRRATGDDHCDYLKRQQRPANRRRTDPVVVMSTMLESILNEMRDLPDVQPFLFPVNAKVCSIFIKLFYINLFYNCLQLKSLSTYFINRLFLIIIKSYKDLWIYKPYVKI